MISIIAAIGKKRELGKNNELIWHLPNDLKYFKEVTINHPIIMGRKTYLSIGRALPKRLNIVLSKTMSNENGIVVINNIKEILDKYQDSLEEAFIIGGSSLYENFLPYAQKLYLTEIDEESDADTYFPLFNKDDYDKEVIGHHNEQNINYDFVIYRKK